MNYFLSSVLETFAKVTDSRYINIESYFICINGFGLPMINIHV